MAKRQESDALHAERNTASNAALPHRAGSGRRDGAGGVVTPRLTGEIDQRAIASCIPPDSHWLAADDA
jgi:hypothetical protein